MQLEQLLRLMTDKEASDLHLKPMRPPLLRVHGRLIPIEADPLTPEQIETMVTEILNPVQKARLQERLSVDLGHGVHGLARFRGNLYYQRGTVAASFRRIPYNIQSIDALELPPVLREFTTINMGLVLITGPTGSGKSTTLAALIEHISRARPVHILTIEDPIEFLFTDQLATISQREVGTDTPTFAEALRNAMREDPDVIMVGEMRDPESVASVITAAETGHLVFSTLHTNSAAQTIDRVLDNFPGNQQNQVRAQLAQVLKAVVSMKLCERQDGSGRVAALEIMRASPRVTELIEKGDTGSLLEEIESSISYYRMQSMNQSLLALLVHGTLSYAEAMIQSPDPDDLSLKLRKMFPTIEEQGGDMGISTADFSQIMELQEFRKLYEEQEEKHRLRIEEKDGEIARLREEIAERDRQSQQARAQIQELSRQQERMRSEYKRLRDEAQEKIDKLAERIKELNQKLMNTA